MKSQWLALESKFNPLTQRERGLIALVVMIAVGMLAMTLLESQWNALSQTKKQLKSITYENSIAEQQIALYQQQLAKDIDEDYRQRLALIVEQIAKVDAELGEQMVDMVPASHMPSMLANLLSNVQGVTLESFTSIAPTPLIQVGEQEKMNLYSHGIELTLTGSYFDILKFIQAVESMPDKLFWQSMDYQVDAYPKGKITLQLYTLSINKDFIGVANQH
ncbi:type 4a pilus biogenesis protein PilO [Shewanella maritima]|uniref:type 4a pilus biogenesis protein PilO n=1 Tax=Shewanella maritima TaxID=2520507 RepID=UPI0037370ECB